MTAQVACYLATKFAEAVPGGPDDTRALVETSGNRRRSPSGEPRTKEGHRFVDRDMQIIGHSLVGEPAVFGDRLMQILAGVAVLLFVSRAVLPRLRGRRAWATWAKWGAIAALLAAICYALGMTLLWALAASR